jgi:hypothetical protein
MIIFDHACLSLSLLRTQPINKRLSSRSTRTYIESYFSSIFKFTTVSPFMPAGAAKIFQVSKVLSFWETNRVCARPPSRTACDCYKLCREGSLSTNYTNTGESRCSVMSLSAARTGFRIFSYAADTTLFTDCQLEIGPSCPRIFSLTIRKHNSINFFLTRFETYSFLTTKTTTYSYVLYYMFTRMSGRCVVID